MITELNYIKGDATKPIGEGNKFLIHICNNQGGWGKGFVLALSKKWKQPRQKYKELLEWNLGDIQFVKVEDDLTVVNMIAQNGYKSPSNPIPLCYDSLKKCLYKTFFTISSMELDNVSIHCPRIGSDLAGGNFDVIKQMLKEVFCNNNIPVNVYEL